MMGFSEGGALQVAGEWKRGTTGLGLSYGGMVCEDPKELVGKAFEAQLKGWVRALGNYWEQQGPAVGPDGQAAVENLQTLLGNFGYKVKRIGDDFRMHGSGDYTLLDIDGQVVQKMRGHSLNTQHFAVDSKEPAPGEHATLAPAKKPAGAAMLDQIRAGGLVEVAKTTFYLKEATVGDFKSQGKLAQDQFMPGDKIAVPDRPRGLSAAQFEYPNHATRLIWERRALTLSKQYLAGLEALYAADDGLVDLEDAKQQIQLRIDNCARPPNLPTKTARLLLNKQLKLKIGRAHV